MKLDKKGFMLAEVVVVSVVIAVVLITLYAGVSKVSSAYSTRNRYYDVDSLYAAMEINDILLRENSSLFQTKTSGKLSNDSEISNFENFYKDTGSSINSYIFFYSKEDNKKNIEESMSTLKNLNSKLTFSEYLDYLSDNIDFSDENYNYMIIVERMENSDINDCYYYALKLKY